MNLDRVKAALSSGESATASGQIDLRAHALGRKFKKRADLLCNLLVPAAILNPAVAHGWKDDRAGSARRQRNRGAGAARQTFHPDTVGAWNRLWRYRDKPALH